MDSIDLAGNLRFLLQVDAIYRKDARLAEFEEKYAHLEQYLFDERAHISNVLQHKHAKKQYVLQVFHRIGLPSE